MFSELENECINREVERLNLPNFRIEHFAAVSYAQAGEDVTLEGMLAARLSKSQRSWESVFYVEIGANQPISTSNTDLMYQRGAQGVLVEPNSELGALIQTVRPRDVLVPSVVLPTSRTSATLFIENAYELSSSNEAHIECFGDFDGLERVREHIAMSAGVSPDDRARRRAPAHAFPCHRQHQGPAPDRDEPHAACAVRDRRGLGALARIAARRPRPQRRGVDLAGRLHPGRARPAGLPRGLSAGPILPRQLFPVI